MYKEEREITVEQKAGDAWEVAADTIARLSQPTSCDVSAVSGFLKR